MIAQFVGDKIRLPGLASAHSHAFQRALRGNCQRMGNSPGSFWSWRRAMYALAQKVTPETIYQLACFAYAELAMAGVTAVGEFHYIHHQLGGQPYDERTILADAMVRAAEKVGIRINLQRVVYQRAGANQVLEAGQERFCDTELDLALADIETLRSRYQSSSKVTVGVAIHSVRAVTRPWLKGASDYAKSHSMPLHMHLSEQEKEVEQCLAEHGLRPVELVESSGLLDQNFVAVHATHLSMGEIKALGAARSFVCICRTTERDLGDGLCDSRGLRQAGVRLCMGVDSHAISDPFEECRAVELDQRSRDKARTLVANPTELLEHASIDGYAALGFAGLSTEDEVLLQADDPSLVGCRASKLDDVVVFGAGPRAVNHVAVEGVPIVIDGVHVKYEEIAHGFRQALLALQSAL